MKMTSGRQPGEEQLTSSSTGVTKLLKHQFLQRIIDVEVSFNLKRKQRVDQSVMTTTPL